MKPFFVEYIQFVCTLEDVYGAGDIIQYWSLEV